ncbi:MAG: hypothetical protein R3F03_00365 [Opitutaceae bacterium]
MNPLRALAESSSFTFLRKLLLLAFLVATLTLSIPLFYLWEKYDIEAFRIVGAIILLIGLMASIFTSREIVFRMEEDPKVGLFDALIHTMYGYLTFLCFAPFIGPALQRFLEKKRSEKELTTGENK